MLDQTVARPLVPVPTTPVLMKAGEVAALLNLGRSTVFELIARGDIPSIRVGRSVRVPRDRLQEWIETRTTGGR